MASHAPSGRRLLRRGQPGGGAHRAAHPWPGVGGGGPDALGQASEHDRVRPLQPRLQQAPDEHAGVLPAAPPAQCPAAAHHGAGQRCLQQAGQGGGRLRRQHGQRGQQLAQVAARACPPRRPKAGLRRGPPVRPPALRRRRAARAARRPGAPPRAARSSRGAGRASSRSRRRRHGRARCRSAARRPASPAFGAGPRRPSPLQRAGGAAAGGGGEAQRRQAGASAGQQRDGRHPVRHGVGQQAQEHGGRRVGQALARAVIGHDAEAAELGGDAASQVAVGRDQGGAVVRRLSAPRRMSAMATASSCWSAAARRNRP